MKKIVLLILAIIAIAMGYFYFRHPLGEKVIIHGYTINVELAVTTSEKERGLGYRDSLPANSGMLFVYQNKDRYGYWMKGMRFPLDYVWINGNQVVDVSPNIPAPSTQTEAPVELSPKVPVDKVLEVNAGIIEKYGIQIGDTVQFAN